MTQRKPRIRREPMGIFPACWRCDGGNSGGFGATPEEAYRNWRIVRDIHLRGLDQHTRKRQTRLQDMVEHGHSRHGL